MQARPRSAIFRDPAPPAVHAPTATPSPSPQKQPELVFHGPPRPLAPNATTHDWCAYLGPFHNATSTERPLRARFGDTGPPRVWEVRKGEGYATASVIGERVLLFHRLADNEVVECLHAQTGQRFWKIAYPSAYQDRYGFSIGPRCQPVSDGKNAYTLGVEGKLHCLSLATGQILWKRDLQREFSLRQNFFGFGAAPLIEAGNLIVNLGADGGPTVAAFDTRTGHLLWGAGREWGQSYASPIPATVHGKRRIFVFAGGEGRPPVGGLLCLDPATGAIDFAFPWRARRYESVNASAPLVIGNRVFVSECYGPGSALLELLPDGGMRTAWTSRALNTHFMTAIHQDGFLYGIDGHGPQNAPLVCIDLNTGRERWRAEPEWLETIPGDDGPRTVRLAPALGALLRVDGRCLLMGEYGHLAWLALDPRGYRELDRTRLFLTRETWGMPALSHGLLYACQNERGVDGTTPRLICYDLRG